MCGIIGQVSSSGSDARRSAGLKAIAHRGPDASGSKLLQCGASTVWLGHSRLSILDLSDAGAQPMQSQDGRWWVSFNGELYNHQDIRAQLSVSCRGTSDTETLVEALAAYGLAATLSKLNGMFAFAALDTEQNELHLVRDPFGIKPVYMKQSANSFSFCSELKGLFELGVPARIDPSGLDSFLTLRYTPSPQTLLRGIERLPPGHVCRVDLGTLQTKTTSYISATQSRFTGSFEDAVVAYKAQLQEAVQRQLLADVPVGLLLSGGIDSALIAAMAKDVGSDLMGFTVGFGNQHNECEISSAEHTAKVLSLPHRYVQVDPESLWDVMKSVVHVVEEPLGTNSILPMWYLVTLARQDATVVLTGQGSDEPWGGYRRYQLELMRARIPQPMLRAMNRLPLEGLNPWVPSHVMRGIRALPKTNPIDRFVTTYELFTPEERLRMTGRSNAKEAVLRIKSWADWQSNDLPLAEQMMRIDTRLNLADDLLLYGDKLSMMVALEARVPMLDIKLMQFIESLPLDYRVTRRESKRVHKAMAERYLPAEIVHRPKNGFQVPFGTWARSIWKERIDDVLLSPGQAHLDYLERAEIERLLHQHNRQRPDRSRQIFSLLMFALWSDWIHSLQS